MAGHRPWKRYACAAHTRDVVAGLRPLVPFADAVDTPVRPAELAEWISVEAEDEPEVDEHGWRIDLDDAVGLLVHPDRDDVADALGEQAGVLSVVQLDREVLVVSAPALCADGLRAAVMQAVAAANGRAHDPATRPSATAPDRGEGALSGPAAAAHTSGTAEASAADDDEARLVTGDARSAGNSVQVWVDLNGILVLPAGTISHGPLDPGENPHLQRASFTPDRAARLAGRHGGRWIPYSRLDRLRLRRPGLFRRRWTATVTERSGASTSLSWRGTRPHALVLWGYVVAKCGLGAVDGLP